MGEAAQIVTAVCSLLTAIVVPLVAGYFLLKQQEAKNAYDLAVIRAKDTADKVEQVKETLAKTTKEQSGKMDKVLKGNEIIHTLVNHERHVLLSAVAIGARTLANHTKDPAHILMADQAEKALAEHDKGQEISDKKDTPVNSTKIEQHQIEGVTTVTAPVLVLPPDKSEP